MKIQDIRNADLRNWVEQHIEKTTQERKAAKAGTSDLRDLWREYQEGDWEALRELIALREMARKRECDESEIEVAILKRMASLPDRHVNGQRYGAAYSLGLEVSVLREFLNVEARPRSRVTVLEEVPFHA